MDGGDRNDDAGDPVEPTDAISTTSDTDDLEDLIQALDPTIAEEQRHADGTSRRPSDASHVGPLGTNRRPSDASPAGPLGTSRRPSDASPGGPLDASRRPSGISQAHNASLQNETDEISAKTEQLLEEHEGDKEDSKERLDESEDHQPDVHGDLEPEVTPEEESDDEPVGDGGWSNIFTRPVTPPIDGRQSPVLIDFSIDDIEFEGEIIPDTPRKVDTPFLPQGLSYGFDSDDDTASDSEDDTNMIGRLRIGGTLLGRLKAATIPTESQGIFYQENKEQFLNAASILANSTRAPLSRYWYNVMQIALIALFTFNVIASLYDLEFWGTPELLHFKVSVLILSIVENVIVFLLFLYQKLKIPDDDSPSSKKAAKKLLYIENGIHEVLIYPLIMVALIGLITEQMYCPVESYKCLGGASDNTTTDVTTVEATSVPEEPPNYKQWFYWVQIVLLLCDLAEVIWTQILRMMIFYKLMGDIHDLIDTPKVRRSQLAGALLQRGFGTLIGNTMVFLYLLLMLGIMVFYDNSGGKDENYSITRYGGAMIVVVVIFPLYSVVMFCVANIYWVLEIFMTVNLRVAEKANSEEELLETFGEQGDAGQALQGILTFAKEKAGDTRKQLADIQDMAMLNKIFSSVYEWRWIPLLFLWGAFVVAAWFSFSGYGDHRDLYIKIGFIVVTVCANYHVTLLTLVAIPDTLIFMAIYPLTFVFFVKLSSLKSLVCCCKKNTKTYPYTAEKDYLLDD